MTEHRQQQKRADNARRRELANDVGPMFEYGVYTTTGRPKPKDRRRRADCKKSLRKFMLTYFKHLFYLAMSPGQDKEIAIMQEVIIQGGTYALAAPRGDGKTTRVEVGTIWAIAYGFHPYVVPVGATQTDGDKILENIKSELSSNDKLAEDFPEICIPAQACEGSPHKAKSLTYLGNKLDFSWAGGMVRLPQIEGSDSFGAIIQPKGLTGTLRGLKFNVPGRGALRPTLFLLDDPQSDESAASPAQCEKRENYIKGAVLGSGGPTDKVSAIMPCTVIKEGDLADMLLDRGKNPQWHGTLRSMVIKFPDCFDPDGVESERTRDNPDKELWWDYHDLRQNDFRNDLIVPKNANQFYINNREAMDKGSEVDNPLRVEKGEISAIQTAMNKFFDNGRAVFFAEYQNQPEDVTGSIYDITSDIVASRVNGFDRLVVPPWAKFLVSMADINYVGLNYVVAAFDNDFTGAVVDHGKWPPGRQDLVTPGTPEAVANKLIAKGILDCHTMIKQKVFNHNGHRRDRDLELIDCNMWTKTAISAVVSLRNPRILPDRGTPASKYRWPQESKRVGPPGDNLHRENSLIGPVQVRHCSDYWRTVAQKAFLQPPGTPGSMSLWGNEPETHRHFATSVCAERLLLFEPAEPNNVYQWRMAPGTPNDLLDALVGCYVGAGLVGAQMPGVEVEKVTSRQRRKNAEQYRKSNNNSTGIRTKY